MNAGKTHPLILGIIFTWRDRTEVDVIVPYLIFDQIDNLHLLFLINGSIV